MLILKLKEAEEDQKNWINRIIVVKPVNGLEL
jgi:hypothetical protein